eukprot:666715-Prorocentrum_minimum.AAC.1
MVGGSVKGSEGRRIGGSVGGSVKGLVGGSEREEAKFLEGRWATGARSGRARRRFSQPRTQGGRHALEADKGDKGDKGRD